MHRERLEFVVKQGDSYWLVDKLGSVGVFVIHELILLLQCVIPAQLP